MSRNFLVFLFVTSFIGVANAQTDSTSNHPSVDTTVSHQPNDSTVKREPVDSAVVHKAADSVAVRKTDSATVKHQTSDSIAIKSKQAESTPKHSPVKTVTKKPVENPEPLHSTVKTITDARYNAYLKGEDLDNMSLAGDLNHFPSPEKVLKYKKQLDLSPIQVTKLTQMAGELHRKKVEMGTNIIRNEKMLDSLFHSRRMDEGSLIFYSNRSGLYYGELKGAILMACYNTEKLLTEYQIKKLEALEKAN